MSFFSINYKGLSYAMRILLGCMIVWWTLSYFNDVRKVWALISVIVVTEPDYEAIRNASISRVINTVVGCLIGLFFVSVFGVAVWSLLAAITVAVVLGTSFNKYPSSWKLAPVTVIIVMMPAVTENAALKDAMMVALTRTGEVLFGCFVAFMLSLIFHFFRKIKTPKKQASPSEKNSESNTDIHE